MITLDLVYRLLESDFWISLSESYHVSSNFVKLGYFIFPYCWWLRSHGMLVVLYVLCILMWPSRDQMSRARSVTFWISAKCSILRLPAPPLWHDAHNWWLITIVWDLVQSSSQPNFLTCPPVGGHMTSKSAKRWHQHNPLRFISTLARLEPCDCDCRQAATSRGCWWWWPSAPLQGFFISITFTKWRSRLGL